MGYNHLDQQLDDANRRARQYGNDQSQQSEVEVLQRRVAQLEAKQAALLIERDFWVEQGRSLQNNLQNWQGMYSRLYDQLGRGVVTTEDIKENLAQASAQLRQPLATVEAIRAMTASMDKATQGDYTSLNTAAHPQKTVSENGHGRR